MDHDDRYLVISADCHAGADIAGYRPYLERDYLDDFDAWAASYENPYDDLTGPDGPRNWDSDRRLREMDGDGIVAEVIFPNTIPPFFPKASLTFQPPSLADGDLDHRWAGLRAHNRWLADFCAAAPGRRAGICQVLLHDIDAAVAEVRAAHAAGLTGGVLLPGVPPGSGLPPLFRGDHYDPLFAVCAELGMPLNNHGGSASPPMEDTVEDPVIFLLEVTWWSHRALAHLIVSGALERHPDLQVVFTEQGTAWVPDELGRLDYFFTRMRTAVGSQEHVWGMPVMAKLPLQPSEYFARQCHIGASFIRPAEVPLRHVVGIDRIMWGSDYPHKESSFPFTPEALRAAFAGVPHDEAAALLGGNAAKLYGFDLDALRPIADRIGPRVGDVDVPLLPGDVPTYAEKCPALAGYGAAAG
ncbi:MAG TPA: amidohydrolase family protein [Ilumatobacteraceae bacterium]|nr:amidohydrolase family protein [Ilumatobacteraceae bacterium]